MAGSIGERQRFGVGEMPAQGGRDRRLLGRDGPGLHLPAGEKLELGGMATGMRDPGR